jgi:hypothetical protein
MQRVVVISYRRLGQPISLIFRVQESKIKPVDPHRIAFYKLHMGKITSVWGSRLSLDFLTLRMGLTCCSKMSVRNYYYTLCKIPEERSSQPLCGSSLKFLNVMTDGF